MCILDGLVSRCFMYLSCIRRSKVKPILCFRVKVLPAPRPCAVPYTTSLCSSLPERVTDGSSSGWSTSLHFCHLQAPNTKQTEARLTEHVFKNLMTFTESFTDHQHYSGHSAQWQLVFSCCSLLASSEAPAEQMIASHWIIIIII